MIRKKSRYQNNIIDYGLIFALGPNVFNRCQQNRIQGDSTVPRKYFNLNISAENYQAYYRGLSQFIVTESEDGQKIRFPANELRKFVSHSGVQGRFEITYNQSSKLIDLRKIG